MSSRGHGLPLQEALRTLGHGLEVGQARRACLTVDASGIAADADGQYGRRTFKWGDLQAQWRAMQAYRRAQPRPVPWMDPLALTRWSVLLRIIGRLLDRQAATDHVVEAAISSAAGPEAAWAQVLLDDRVLLDTPAVLKELEQLRGACASAAAPAAQRRRSWLPWRWFGRSVLA